MAESQTYTDVTVIFVKCVMTFGIPTAVHFPLFARFAYIWIQVKMIFSYNIWSYKVFLEYHLECRTVAVLYYT